MSLSSTVIDDLTWPDLTSVTPVSVLFPCTGRVSAVVEVDIMLNITTYQPKQQIVFIKLKRRKTCLQGKMDVWATALDPRSWRVQL